MELNIRSKYGLNIIAVKREADVIVSPRADCAIYENDILVAIGRDTDLTRVRGE